MGFKVSKAKEYAVIYLGQQGKSVEDIAEELSIAVSTVQTILDENPIGDKVPTPKQRSFITKTAGKGNSGITILTPEGSAIGDDAKYSSNN